MYKKSILVQKILNSLENNYKKYNCELKYQESWQLLVAIILSAQSTDKTVNSITPVLFQKYKTITDLYKANLNDVEKIIFKSGFYHNKAKNIINATKFIINDYNGKIPDNISDMIKIPGVGRKTANVFISETYNNAEGIVVDTHVMRLSTKIWGLSDKKTADKIEEDLMKIIYRSKWVLYSFAVVLHGRYICIARNPKCDICFMNTFCPYYLKFKI